MRRHSHRYTTHQSPMHHSAATLNATCLRTRCHHHQTTPPTAAAPEPAHCSVTTTHSPYLALVSLSRTHHALSYSPCSLVLTMLSRTHHALSSTSYMVLPHYWPVHCCTTIWWGTTALLYTAALLYAGALLMVALLYTAVLLYAGALLHYCILLHYCMLGHY